VDKSRRAWALVNPFPAFPQTGATEQSGASQQVNHVQDQGYALLVIGNARPVGAVAIGKL